jgi:hypothetical protein
MKKKKKAKKKGIVDDRKKRIEEDCSGVCADTSETICPECSEWGESLRTDRREHDTGVRGRDDD